MITPKESEVWLYIAEHLGDRNGYHLCFRVHNYTHSSSKLQDSMLDKIEKALHFATKCCNMHNTRLFMFPYQWPIGAKIHCRKLFCFAMARGEEPTLELMKALYATGETFENQYNKS